MAILIRQRHFSILYLVAITSLLIRMKSFICPRIFRKSIVGRSHLFYMSSHTGSCERTEVSIRPTDWKIDHTTPVHLVGSCFTDTITTSLKRNKFNCFSNGQGIMFNPISISECLSNVIKSKCTWSFSLSLVWIVKASILSPQFTILPYIAIWLTR